MTRLDALETYTVKALLKSEAERLEAALAKAAADTPDQVRAVVQDQLDVVRLTYHKVTHASYLEVVP